jgi:hypothetical protein
MQNAKGSTSKTIKSQTSNPKSLITNPSQEKYEQNNHCLTYNDITCKIVLAAAKVATRS